MNTEDRRFLERLGQVGPEEAEYRPFAALLTRVLEGSYDADVEIAGIREALADSLDLSTLQGFALRKPHGYAGDYEIIDRIYLQHHAAEPCRQRWDRYFHAQAATRAVRNRKSYFHRLLGQLVGRKPESARVLNLASGPCRCIQEWLSRHPEPRIHFDCVDNDPEAIRYASGLNSNHLDRVTFTCANALNVDLEFKYDLIWVAGLCDYVTDSRLKRLIRRLSGALVPGGELVLGNFGDFNPSRAYMEIVGDWKLLHRSAGQFLMIAREAGIDIMNARVGAEQEGVNLFLHVMNR